MPTEAEPSAAMPSRISRRLFLAGLPLALSACVTGGAPRPRLIAGAPDPTYAAMYAAVPEERFPLPAIDLTPIKPIYWRQQVPYNGYEPVGTIVVDPYEKFLYLVQPGGTAMRYGIGVGRDGFSWNGRAVIRRKAQWPTWTPPAEMVARDPKSAVWAKGMPPSLQNPLGARALYLYQGNVDTLYRIHGTNEPWSIGTAVSSGCIRMLNQDVIDLYNRVPVGTEVVVLDSSGFMASVPEMVSNAVSAIPQSWPPRVL